MTKAWILVNLTMLLMIRPCYSQSSADINNLIMKSKLVDIGRQVNTTIAPDKTTISTYCSPRATDQDCKVTALLMMKELKQHYKSIHRIHVLFFDPSNPGHFREVEIREGDTLLVDQGKPVKEVLSQIDVTNRTVANTQNGSSSLSRRSGVGLSGMTGVPHHKPSPDEQSGFANYRSAQGDVTMLYPKTWILGGTDMGGTLLSVNTLQRDGTGSIAIYRQAVLGMSLDDVVNLHELAQCKLKDYRKINRRSMNCSGLSGIYEESSATAPNGSTLTERAEFVRGQNQTYILVMITTGLNDSDMSRLFNTMFNSLKIQS